VEKAKVFVTSQFPEQALALLGKTYDLVLTSSSENLSKETFIEKAAGCKAILVEGTKIDAEICEAVKSHCQIITCYGVGYDNVDVEAATRSGILVTHNPGVVTDSTADLTWGLLIAVSRRIAEGDSFVRSGNKKWGPSNLLGAEVSGKTLGIIGAGRIGTAVAKRGLGFNMRILYAGRKPKEEFEKATGGVYVSKEVLLGESDFVCVHLPLNTSTHHYMGAEELSMMKKHAILINTSRGAVIDEAALVSALNNELIRGAGLDVFENEPHVNPSLASMNNVVMTPHIGTGTLEITIKMGDLCAQKIEQALDGRIPDDCLNPTAVLNWLE